MYLGGLVLDCLLKARLLEKHPSLQSADPSSLSAEESRRWTLVYRLHDLDLLIAEVPELMGELQDKGGRVGGRLDMILRSACSRWSVGVRYWPKRVDMVDAERFLQQVEELRKWL